MGSIDSLISIIIVIAFIAFVGSKIHSHEKEHLDPFIKKVKGWFIKDDGGDSGVDPNDDFEIGFKGQVQ